MNETLSMDESAILDRITESPRFFIEEVLGEKLDEQQIPIVEQFPRHRKISIKSGHS